MTQHNTIDQDFKILTSNITDIADKPMLRSSIALALVELEHSLPQVNTYLDSIYKKSVH